MKSKWIVLSGIWMVFACITVLAYAGASDKTTNASDGTAMIERTVKRLKSIKDIAEVSMADRKQLLDDATKAFPPAQVVHNAYLETYVKDVLTCLDWLSSCDFGNRTVQNALSQRMVMDCLPLADRIHIELEARLISQMRKQLDAEGNKATGREWASLRNRLLEYRMHLWRRIVNEIDSTWDPKDLPLMNISVPGTTRYSAGVAPESIKEPEIRKQYEAVLEANRKKSERYLEQKRARDLRGHYLPRLKKAIAESYGIGPVSDEDLEILKAYLRIYVSDAKLRIELRNLAYKAAGIKLPKGEKGQK